MELTGRKQTVGTVDLIERRDGFWQDTWGKKYDIRRDGNVFEERRPGVWYRIKGEDNHTRPVEGVKVQGSGW